MSDDNSGPDDDSGPRENHNTTNESNRREFFGDGPVVRQMREALAKAKGVQAGNNDGLQPGSRDELKALDHLSRESRSRTHLETYSARAMACDFELMFNMHQYQQSGPAALRAFEILEEYESLMSVYRDDSEMSLINRSAAKENVVIESALFDMLSLGKQIHEKTRGAFDMTSGPLTTLWGFDQRQGKVPDASAIKETLENVGSEKVQLNSESSSVRFSQPGVMLNPGGIGKGYALDQIAKHIQVQGIDDFVIHGGQSSVVARGSSEPGNADAGWLVGLSHPTIPGIRLGEVRLQDCALGTSGSGRQGFFHKGKRFGHIIDPRTGWPASHTLSSTVVTSKAAMADALATAFFVMQPDEVAAYCASNPDVAAILVVAENDSGKVITHRFNLSDENWIESEQRL